MYSWFLDSEDWQVEPRADLTRSCRDHMIFFSHAFQFKKAPEYLPLIRIWVLEDSELAPLGLQVTKRIDSPDFPDKELRRTVCWTGAAILEFQDLQAITFPQTGRFFNIWSNPRIVVRS